MLPTNCFLRLICAIHIHWPAQNTSEEETQEIGMELKCNLWAVAKRKLMSNAKQHRTRRSCRIAWVEGARQGLRNRQVKGLLLLILEVLVLLSQVEELIFLIQRIKRQISTWAETESQRMLRCFSTKMPSFLSKFKCGKPSKLSKTERQSERTKKSTWPSSMKKIQSRMGPSVNPKPDLAVLTKAPLQPFKSLINLSSTKSQLKRITIWTSSIKI
jgi:hypothetical protein